jgi:hypothetical protein
MKEAEAKFHKFKQHRYMKEAEDKFAKFKAEEIEERRDLEAQEDRVARVQESKLIAVMTNL